MFGIAARGDVQVRVVAQDTGSLHRSVGILFRECLQPVVGLLIYKVTLLDPPLDAARRAHSCEPLLAVEDFEALSVLHCCDAIVNGCNLVAESGLRCRNVSYFEDTMASAAAGSKHKKATEGQRTRQPAYTRCLQQPHGFRGNVLL